jgi:Ca2+-transporting ATPase
MVGSANSSRGDSNDNHAIPSINITTDSSTPALIISPNVNHNVSTLQSPVSPGLLSPISYNPRSSYDGPPSPTFSDISDTPSALTTPPSPTLSNHSSVHFQSSLALRDNKPEQKSGMSSLGLLNADDASTSGLSHHRKLSNATFSSMTETEGDHAHLSDLRHVKSNATSFTHVDSHSVSRGSHKKTDSQEVEYQERKPKMKGEHDTDGEHQTTHQKELAQDEAVDCTPFAFKPFQLAHMLDPKSVEMLASFGGTDGLLRGLGTSADHGLKSPPRRTETVSEKGEPGVLGAGQGVSHRHDPEKGGGNDTLVPQIMLTEPNGGISSPTEGEHPAAQATFEDRRRVYGENILPQRASKTLLQLMWMALKDKVLILLSIAAIVSLALGLFQDLKPNRDTTEAPVDWVEGVAIMVAIGIVVIVGSLNDWQKERQFQTLNEKKEERGVKVIRDGVEKVVDVKEVVVGDIALLEPGEIIPCDGIFISGHNVKCDESGATGESDAIKKAPFHDVVQLHKAKGPHAAHSDCFMISGSKVLEGVGKYVIVAVGTKSFNGRIMMGMGRSSLSSCVLRSISPLLFSHSPSRRRREYSAPDQTEQPC